MPEKETLERARRDKRAGKAPSTQAGEFVREEIDHIREGKHGARSAKQAIAIGLSKARRAGVELPPPTRGTTAKTRKSAARDYERGQGSPPRRAATSKRSQASEKALERESTGAASPEALAAQARSAAKRRSPTQRSDAARRAAQTKAAEARTAAARRTAQHRSAHPH
jgi:hypothetical protein